MSDPEYNRREIYSWAFYDFANSAFATTILAVIFNQYFALKIAGGGKGGNDPRVGTCTGPPFSPSRYLSVWPFRPFWPRS